MVYSPLRGRLAQRESAAFTRQRSLVRTQHRPHPKYVVLQVELLIVKPQVDTVSADLHKCSAHDNALAESFVATLKAELLYRSSWPTRQVARTAIFEYIEGFYNTRKGHSALGYLNPAEFEEIRLGEEDAA
jgi:hypothetical protein